MRKIKKCIRFILLVLVFTLVGYASSSTHFKGNYKIKSGRDIILYTAADLHYLSDSLTDHGEAFKKYVSSGDGKDLEYVGETLDAFAYGIQKAKPDILVISGDLTNNGEKASHLELAEKLKRIEKSGTSVYVVPGNHDILNPEAVEYIEDDEYFTENISVKDFSKIYAAFGYDEAISKDKDTLSYLAAPSADMWLLMLDTNQYQNNYKLGFPQTDGKITQDTLNWIEECCALARDNGANIVTVMHHNILNHSDIIPKGYTLNNSTEALTIFKENKLNLILSGHIHIQDISSDGKNTNSIYDIVTGALPVYPHQYGRLRYSAVDGSFDYSTLKVDVEEWSKSKQITDENLNNFSRYSEDYFREFSYDMTCRYFTKNRSYSENEKELMLETMKILNLRYFAGTEDLNPEDIINSEGYKLWLDSPKGFLRNYVLSISNDKDTDDNHLHIITRSGNAETNGE